MRRLILPTCVLAAAMITMLNGCIAFYRYVPVEITLTELESGEPAGGVPIGVTYSSAYILNPPKREEWRITDSDGTAVLQIATFAQTPEMPPNLKVEGEMEVRGEVRTYHYWFDVPLTLLREGGIAPFRHAPFPDAPRYEVQIKPTRQRGRPRSDAP